MKNSPCFRPFAACILAAALAPVAGCSPVVRVEAPREPITINLNIKLDADVRVKLEDQAKKDIAKNPDIF
jgi:hypothetical protein